MNIRQLALVALGAVVCAPLARAQQDTTHVPHLLREWQAIENAAVRLLLAQGDARRRAIADSLVASIQRANAEVDDLQRASPRSFHPEDLDALRIRSVLLDSANHLQHPACLPVDPTSARRLLVSAIVRKIVFEQCILDDLVSRGLDRRALLTSISRASNQDEVSRLLADSLKEQSRRLGIVERAIATTGDSTVHGSVMVRLGAVEDRTRQVTQALSVLQLDTGELTREIRALHALVQRECWCMANCLPNDRGNTALDKTIKACTPNTPTPGRRSALVFGLLGALVGGTVVGIAAR